MTARLTISRSDIAATLAPLRDAGRQRRECVVLWFADGDTHAATVRRVHVPEQFAREDVFRIPPHAMRDVLERLRSGAVHIGAQIHSHPAEAFHSYADDQWAIVRHLGALSVVLPFFASTTTVESFLADAAVFALDASNHWVRVQPEALGEIITVTP